MNRTPFLPLILLALLAGCTSRPASTSDGLAPNGTPDGVPDGAPADSLETQADYEAALAWLSGRMDTAIGGAAAESVEACRVIGVGVKPCGGPWDYRVYSETDGAPEDVRRLVAEYDALNAEMNRRFELVSTCEFRLPPTPALEDGRCVAGPPDMGG